MRIVVTADTHFPVDPERIPDGDVFIHAGDLMYRGTPDEWNPCKDWLGSLPHKYKFFIPGNHDFFPEMYLGLARAELRRQCGVRLVSPDSPVFMLPNGMTAVGCSFVTGLAGWAYPNNEAGVLEWLEALTVEPDVMVTHAPVYGILDAVRPQEIHEYKQGRVGSMAFNRWFHRRRDAGLKVPLLWFSGHIHESYGRTNVGGTHFYNAAMCDRKYDQTNEPWVIDL